MVRMASLLLYEIYSDDPRYVIDQDEKKRLNIADDPDFKYADCADHHACVE